MNNKESNIEQNHGGSGDNVGGDKYVYNFANPDFSIELALAVLIGSWDESKKDDIEAIEYLTNQKYSDWRNKIRQIMANGNNSIIYNSGIWKIKDRLKNWNRLASRLYDEHLDRFRDISIIIIFNEINPSFELKAENRFMASLRGKVLSHSKVIRKGISEGTALVSAKTHDLIHCKLNHGKNIADEIVRDIFNNSNWKLWASTQDIQPAMAEASPDEFLKAVENALLHADMPFNELFSQEGSGITRTTYISGLLWALEGLAWSPDYLIRCIGLLAKMADDDPGGNWSNRPINSIITILLPWCSQTLAPLENRIAAIKVIRMDFPKIAWEVLLKLMRNQNHTSFNTHRPKWRSTFYENWNPNITDLEYDNQLETYAEIIIELVSEKTDFLIEIVDKLPSLPPKALKEALKILSSKRILELSEGERQDIWETILELLTRHRCYSHADWALNEEILIEIEKIAKTLVLSSPQQQYARLFNGRDSDLYEKMGDFDNQAKILESKRSEALKQILNISGIEGIIAFSNMVDSPTHVGLSLGRITDIKHKKLLPDLLDAEGKTREFISHFVLSKYRSEDWKWVDNLNRNKWTIEQTTNFLIFLPFNDGTWDRVKNWLLTAENEYWNKVWVRPYSVKSNLLFAVDKLLEVNRADGAVDCIYCVLLNKAPLDKKRTVKVLLAATETDRVKDNMDLYHIEELIKALQEDPETDEDDLFWVEWAYVSLLDGRHGHARPKILEKRLAKDPKFFCEVIQLIYKSAKTSANDKESDKNKKPIVVNAWHLLFHWNRIPGLLDDGSFNSDDFDKWFMSVKSTCEESGHLEVAMSEIGKVLFYSPSETDEFWILKHIAKILNGNDGDQLRNSYRREAFNSIGVRTIEPTAKQELYRAKSWRKRSDKIELLGYTRFALTLRNIAEDQEFEAQKIMNDHYRE